MYMSLILITGFLEPKVAISNRCTFDGDVDSDMNALSTKKSPWRGLQDACLLGRSCWLAVFFFKKKAVAGERR